MGAPKGNQYAKGHGKPRLYDRDKVFDDVIEWAKQDDSINLNEFCAYYEPSISPKKLSEWAKENPCYRESYDIAKAFLACRRECWLNIERLHVKAYDLNAANYDYFLKEYRMEELEYQEKVKSQALENIDPYVKAQQEALMTLLQSSKSARKEAANSTSIEQ